MNILPILIAIAAAFLIYSLVKTALHSESWSRLITLSESDRLKSKLPPLQPDSSLPPDLYYLSNRLGKAGFTSIKQQKNFLLSVLGLFCLAINVAIILFCFSENSDLIIAGAFLPLLVLITSLVYLVYKTRDYERQVIFNIPITLEALILLIESGLGLLPAIEQLSNSKAQISNPVSDILRAVHSLSDRGAPLSEALVIVSELTDIRILKHVLLHLDISATEGAELIPSLRGLSEYAHQEWQSSVETRVRRLENLVVFPVFASVLGLMLLAAAVPVIPLLEFTASLKQQTVAMPTSVLNSDHL